MLAESPPTRRARAPRSSAMPPRRTGGDTAPPAVRGGGKLWRLFAVVAALALCSAALFATTFPLNRQSTNADWARGLISPLDAFPLRSLRDENATTGDVSGAQRPIDCLPSPTPADASSSSPPPFQQPDPHHDAELKLPLPDGPELAAVAASFAADSWTPKMLAVLVDFVRRRLPELDVITSGGARAGLYVSDAASLRNGVEAARSRLNADCRRDDIKPVSCVITSGESAFIQEFLAWHILLGWAHFVVVADVREPRPAHLRAALRPFIDAGFVSLAHLRADVAGGSNQRHTMDTCVAVLQKVGCTIRHPRGDLGTNSPEFSAADGEADTAPGDEAAEWARHAGLLGADMQRALDEGPAALGASSACAGAPATWQQQLWLAGGDDDEYYYVRDYAYPPALPPAAPAIEGAPAPPPLTDTPETHMCLPRFLRRFYGRGAVSIERLFYGGRYRHAHRPGDLVTEAYTHRWAVNSDLGKVLAQVADIESVYVGGHAVTYAAGSGRGLVDTLARPMRSRIQERRPVSAAPPAAVTPPAERRAPGSPGSKVWPPVAVAHFFGRSVERSLLKWVRGVASMNGGGGAAAGKGGGAKADTPKQRPPAATGARAAKVVGAAGSSAPSAIASAAVPAPFFPAAGAAARGRAALEVAVREGQIGAPLRGRSLLAAPEPAGALGEAEGAEEGGAPDAAESEDGFGSQPAPARLRAPPPAAKRARPPDPHALPPPPPQQHPAAPADAAAQRAVDASLDTMAHRMYAPGLVLQQSLEYAAPGAGARRLFGAHDPLPRVLVQATRLVLGLLPEQP